MIDPGAKNRTPPSGRSRWESWTAGFFTHVFLITVICATCLMLGYFLFEFR